MPIYNGRKYFIPIENNPEVMTELMLSLGLSSTHAFHDVYSLTEPDLLAMVPRPATALVLCFPVSKILEDARAAEDAPKTPYTGSGPEEPVVWFQQTVRNACGLYGLLHGVLNGPNRELLAPGSELHGLLNAAIPLAPEPRAQLIYDSEALEKAHGQAAAGGDSAAPELGDEVENHYVAFVKGTDGHLWELDGVRKGPIDRGVLAADDDVLSAAAVAQGPMPFLKREEEAGGGELRFSIVALGPALD